MLKTNYLVIFMFAISMLLTIPVSINAGTIAVGEAMIFDNNTGSARRQALLNAQRNAVKQEAGLILSSQTVVKNWAVVKNEIFASAKGIVTKYRILEDKQQGGSWHVKIDAEVSSSKIIDKAKELLILHKKMGNKRFVIIYAPENRDALNPKHGAVLSAMTSIPTELNKAGFRVFNKRTLGVIYDKIRQSGQTTEERQKIVSQYQSDMLIEIELIANNRRKFSKNSISWAKVKLRMLVYDISTGREISKVQSDQKQSTNARVGSYDWEDALSRAGERAGRTATLESINNIIEYYESVGDVGNAYNIVFKNFSEDEEDIIMDTLENLEGYQSIEERKSIPQLLEVEYFSTLKGARLKRKIRLDFKKKGVKLKTFLMEGNKIIFSKP